LSFFDLFFISFNFFKVSLLFVVPLILLCYLSHS
jgi:hypothetical protein